MIANIAFYKFTKINTPAELKGALTALCQRLKLKGTILIATEGINGMLAGEESEISEFKLAFNAYSDFQSVKFRESRSETVPFRRLLIKVKKEILTLREPHVDPSQKTGSYVKPQELEQWLKAGEDVVLLDTRNAFEVEYGTFKKALNPEIKSFGQFPQYVREKLNVPKEKKIVTFCTGGIRCEKATAVMLEEGYKNVYQLEGGILEYFAKTPAEFWDGTCFVFDEREALGKDLKAKKA